MKFAHRTYATDSKFKAAKPFIMNGVEYNYDDPVDLSGVDARRVKLMFDTRLIDVDDRDAAPAPKRAAKASKPAAKQEQAAAPAEPVAQAEPGAQSDEASEIKQPSGDPADYKLKNGGFGRWYITDAEGTNIAGPFKDGDAKAKAQEALAKMQQQ